MPYSIAFLQLLNAIAALSSIWLYFFQLYLWGHQAIFLSLVFGILLSSITLLIMGIWIITKSFTFEWLFHFLWALLCEASLFSVAFLLLRSLGILEWH